MATPFFASCPSGSAPTIQGKPSLNVTTAMPTVGSSLSIALNNASAVNTQQTLYCGFASGLGAGFTQWSNGTCMVHSANVTDGQTCTFLTSSGICSLLTYRRADVVLTTGPSVDDASVVAGPAIIQLGASNATTAVRAARASGSGMASASGSAPSGSASGSAMPMSGAGVLQISGGLSILAGAVALLL